MKMKIIIQFITIWSNDSSEVLLKTKINTKKCGKITTHKLQMDIIIKITMDMQDMKVLTKHGVTQHTLIITIMVPEMEQDMVAMVVMVVMVVMDMVAME